MNGKLHCFININDMFVMYIVMFPLHKYNCVIRTFFIRTGSCTIYVIRKRGQVCLASSSSDALVRGDNQFSGLIRSVYFVGEKNEVS